MAGLQFKIRMWAIDIVVSNRQHSGTDRTCAGPTCASSPGGTWPARATTHREVERRPVVRPQVLHGQVSNRAPVAWVMSEHGLREVSTRADLEHRERVTAGTLG